MSAKTTETPDIRSETATLVALLLADYEPSTLAAVLTVDERTLRRWRNGEDAGHTAAGAEGGGVMRDPCQCRLPWEDCPTCDPDDCDDVPEDKPELQPFEVLEELPPPPVPKVRRRALRSEA